MKKEEIFKKIQKAVKQKGSAIFEQDKIWLGDWIDELEDYEEEKINCEIENFAVDFVS